ncbi:MAG: hypothetical protein N3E49_08355 [Bacteroidia bacterium]|nr:hypothetical protein [Bacteroidia bacterium]
MWESVLDAWHRFCEVLGGYEETLQSELSEAIRLRDMARLTELEKEAKRLRQLKNALRRAEKILLLQDD